VCLAVMQDTQLMTSRLLAQETARSAKKLNLSGVEECWLEAEAQATESGSKKHSDDAEAALEAGLQEICKCCCYIACAQLKHGLYTAYYEGRSAKKNFILRSSPGIPLALTWVNKANPSQVYGTGLAGANIKSSLLEALLGAGTRAQYDLRHISPENKDEFRAVVSLLRNFEDITANPDWTPGVHGLWYTAEDDIRVFLPSSIERLVREADSPTEHTSRVLRLLTTSRTTGAEEDEEIEVEGLPAGATLFRFTVKDATLPMSDFPTMYKRLPHKDNITSMAVLQAKEAKGLMEDESGMVKAKQKATSRVDIAATLCQRGTASLRGLILPPAGAYHNLHHHFHHLRENVIGFHGPVEQVQRVFVLASVWDSYVDGCAVLERRCAWYGNMHIDLHVLEKFRKSGHFSVVTMEQDRTERSIEALLPVLMAYLGEDHDFTLVPILVGGLPSSSVQVFVDVLAEYAKDPRNLFLVAGDCEQLQRDMEEETDRDMMAYSCPSRHLVDALELYFATLSDVEDSEVEIKWFSTDPDAAGPCRAGFSGYTTASDRGLI